MNLGEKVRNIPGPWKSNKLHTMPENLPTRIKDRAFRSNMASFLTAIQPEDIVSSLKQALIPENVDDTFLLLDHYIDTNLLLKDPPGNVDVYRALEETYRMTSSIFWQKLLSTTVEHLPAMYPALLEAFEEDGAEDINEVANIIAANNIGNLTRSISYFTLAASLGKSFTDYTVGGKVLALNNAGYLSPIYDAGLKTAEVFPIQAEGPEDLRKRLIYLFQANQDRTASNTPAMQILMRTNAFAKPSYEEKLVKYTCPAPPLTVSMFQAYGEALASEEYGAKFVERTTQA